ncbi:hypothetical protein QE417_001151 [Mucilaginibacter terrae]|uniref:Uncharacterized protein n=1 Tax=Mucilaginibacter terrae TaxID=1955052 RepID=A0ABU3GQM1_9SPHI|nr:hypothetical protein [Mucilaginibacter terrae]
MVIVLIVMKMLGCFKKATEFLQNDIVNLKMKLS